MAFHLVVPHSDYPATAQFVGQQMQSAIVRSFCLRTSLGLCLLSSAFALPSAAASDPNLAERLSEIEVDLLAFPKQAEASLDVIDAQTRSTNVGTRRFAVALSGQAMVAAGHLDQALKLADQLEREGQSSHDDAAAAIALLIRGDAQVWAGDVTQANQLANNARKLARNASDGYIQFWAAIEVGVTARMLGHVDEALASLQEALSVADVAQNPYRRANALYQLSVLNRAQKKADNALHFSRRAFDQAKLAGSTYGMAKAKMAESAALEMLNQPTEELATMQEALAIARTAHSSVEESLALVNLADIYLRRKDFKAVLEMSERSLDLSTQSQDGGLIATNKANMGFALFGLGRIDEGKRLAEEALVEYERTGADADTADLLAEYGQYLVNAGDYKGALALRDRQQKIITKIMNTVRQMDLAEMQSKFDAERRIAEIERQHREFQQRIWWLFAVGSAGSLITVMVLYRKLRATNRALARQNSELGFFSSRDPLTSLYNRRHFQSFIDEEPGEKNRRRGPIEKPIQAILLIDIDHFKSINDLFGHAAGDAVLIAVARRLRDALRETDMIVRWGGDEFLVFVPLAPAERLDEIALRVLQITSAEPISFLGRAIHVTVSVGYAPMVLPPHDIALGWERALDLVDKALYVAKNRGRNRAFGVTGLRSLGDDAQTTVDGDLEKAWHDGVVDGCELLVAIPTIVSAAARTR